MLKSYTLHRITRPLPSFWSSLDAAIKGERLGRDQLISLVQANKKEETDALHDAASDVTRRVFGNEISLRGIVEFSNVCDKRCYYCGVPSYESKGFLMSHESILECCDFMYEKGYRNLVLQSGEIQTNERINWLISLLKKIQNKFGSETNKGFCVILSVGELSKDQYLRLKEAGSHRFLLRIETSDPDLYASMHPPDHRFIDRLNALLTLKELGFVTGTGVMIGVPNQTYENIARDIEFFRDNQFHMIGLGPYVIHKDTVMGRNILKDFTMEQEKEIIKEKVEATLNVYNIIRLQSPYANIAATTALETISPGAKARALTGGSNVLMPIITPKEFRGGYQLYEGKKEVDMDRLQTHNRVLELMKQIGKVAVFNRWNHPPLFTKDHPEFKNNK